MKFIIDTKSKIQKKINKKSQYNYYYILDEEGKSISEFADTIKPNAIVVVKYNNIFYMFNTSSITQTQTFELNQKTFLDLKIISMTQDIYCVNFSDKNIEELNKNISNTTSIIHINNQKAQEVYSELDTIYSTQTKLKNYSKKFSIYILPLIVIYLIVQYFFNTKYEDTIKEQRQLKSQYQQTKSTLKKKEKKLKQMQSKQSDNKTYFKKGSNL